MLNRIFLPPIILVLLYGFWVSAEFRVVAAGVAVFLFGMIYLEKGFKVFTGSLLERLLKKITGSLWKSLTFGVVTTSLLQSSSLVSIIIISFLSAGLIGLTAGVGIILGANLGSTTGAWLIAVYGMKVNLAVYGMPLLVLGLLLNTRNHHNLKGVGLILLGIGFLFLGIDYMKEGFEKFQQSIDLSRFQLAGITGLLLYTLLGVFATTVMQSTNATLVLVFSALSTFQLGYENAIALSIGSNIGTTVTAMLGAISANAQGKRLAVAHFLFNVFTATLALCLFYPLLDVVEQLSGWIGIDSSNTAIKLALFHTLFNLTGILLMLPVINRLVAWLDTLFCQPAKASAFNTEGSESVVERAVYLNHAVLGYPDAALRAMTKECARLYRNTLELICYGIYLSGDKLRKADNLTELVNNWERQPQPWPIKVLYFRHIKGIYGDIIHYGGALEGSLTRQQAQELFALKVACRNFVQAIKHIKHIYKNMGLYIESENDEIRHQYNQLRICLASVLKLVDVLGVRRNYQHIREHAEQLKQELQEQDQLTHNTLNTLIRSRQVDSHMAGSLMNDSAHVHDACTCLIDGAVIMVTRDQEEYRSGTW
ncbi:hypothetical protein CI610_00396 [invertebrate metagenome]|uniref:PhoU domain-containing protein n=1 Tax=invertebrate metagenome TaxID=1711999 RepID=A0A2H9TBN6_9ZZZZ